MAEENKVAEVMTETSILKPGVAPIKNEYIDVEHKRTMAEQLLPKSAAEEIKRKMVEAEKQGEGPPRKKAKLKGQNKGRPIEKRPTGKDRLCAHIVAENDCPWGEKCKYQHNIAEYMKTKPEDLGPECYVYKTFGKCSYSVACRYAKSHITEEYKNKTQPDMKDQTKTFENTLNKDLQIILRKKKYNFQKANEIIGKLNMKHGHCNKEKLDIVKQVEVSDHVNNEKTTCDNESAEEMPVSSDTGTNVVKNSTQTTTGALTDEGEIRLRPQEKKLINFADKSYLAPLTTVGNLPFRRICKRYGVDITCGEMALSTNLLQGTSSEWALLRRHESEDIFGVQVCGGYPDTMTRCAQLLTENTNVDFIDINCGCPIDLIFKRGEGSALMGRVSRLENVVKGMKAVMDIPLTVKMRTGIYGDKSTAHTIIPQLRDWGVSLVTLHGRSREQRYTRLADWDYISKCAQAAGSMPLFGNGDILSYEDVNLHREASGVSGVMVARGALIKPWLFTEIKEQRHWDISASERLDMLKDFTNYGLEHWGSDTQGVMTTRKFMLEWLSFLYRYIPVGILERVPQKINERPPRFFGRNDLETLFASPNSADWVKISEMLLGKVSDGFTFLPKHRANAYQ